MQSRKVIYIDVGPLVFSVLSVLALVNGGSVSVMSRRSLAASLAWSCFSVTGGSLKR